MEYSLSNHARERYAERIMGKDDKMDVQSFIMQHEDKIYDDISQMIEYGEVIYEGQQVRSKDTRPCKYYFRNDWIVVVNPQDKKVVTLFKIDLGAGDEMNKLYIHTMLQKLNEAKAKVADNLAILKELKSSYENAIQENNELIADYKSKIKSLENQNDSLNKLLQEEKTNIAIAEEEMRDVIATLTAGTKFQEVRDG